MIADGDRSCNHMLNSGTTITWEAWDLKYKPNQDWNHAWDAAPENLLPRDTSLGLNHSTPAGKLRRSALSPAVCSTRGRVPTSRGPIEIDWKSGATFDLSLALPEGMSAYVSLPKIKGATGVLVDRKPVDATKTRDRWNVGDKVRVLSKYRSSNKHTVER